MKIAPPAVASNRNTVRNSAILAAVSAAVAVFCGWQLFSLPGSLIRMYNAPPDMPWYGHGIRQMAIDGGGTFHIARMGYADRSVYYKVNPDSPLHKSYSVPVDLTHLDVSGNMAAQAVSFASGRLRVKSSAQYWAWRYRLKNLSETPAEIRRAYLADGSQDMVGPHDPVEPHLVAVFSNPDKKEIPALGGFQYFKELDSAAAKEPNLWVTTDRGRFLHRLVYRETAGSPAFDVVSTSETGLSDSLLNQAALCYQPTTRSILLLRPDGLVHAFDPVSLAEKDVWSMPGVWDYEYAEVFHTGSSYSFYHGLPLTITGYTRIMRLMMLVFMASLLILAVAWSRRCFSNSDQTTEDMTPKSN